MMKSQKIVVAVAAGVFLCQLVAVVALSPHFGNEVDAAAEGLTAETVKYVPASIVDGGSSTASAPAESSAVLRLDER